MTLAASLPAKGRTTFPWAESTIDELTTNGKWPLLFSGVLTQGGRPIQVSARCCPSGGWCCPA